MKKRIILCFIAVISLLFCLSVNASAVHGDINEDGYVGIEDAIEAMRFFTDIDTPDDWEFNNADVDRDGYITSEDVRIILRTAGDIQYLPDHLYSEWETQTEPTCTESGLATSYCIYCGRRAEKQLEPKGHDIVPATCSENGYCKNGCNYSEPLLSHTEENGYCTVCKAKIASAMVTYKGEKIAFECTPETVETILGSPADTITDSYGEKPVTIYVYFTSYKDLGVFTFTDGKLTQFFTNHTSSYVSQGSGKYSIKKADTSTTRQLGDLFIRSFIDTLETNKVYSFTAVFGQENYYSFNETKNTPAEKLIFHLTNGCRALNGAEPLTYSSAVAKVARAHSKDMATNNYFSHADENGLRVSDRLNNAGIKWYHCGENIAAGYPDPYVVTNGWYNSESHRNIMVSYKYKYIGIGIAFGKDSELKYYSTQNYYNDEFVE